LDRHAQRIPLQKLPEPRDWKVSRQDFKASKTSIAQRFRHCATPSKSVCAPLLRAREPSTPCASMNHSKAPTTFPNGRRPLVPYVKRLNLVEEHLADSPQWARTLLVLALGRMRTATTAGREAELEAVLRAQEGCFLGPAHPQDSGVSLGIVSRRICLPSLEIASGRLFRANLSHTLALWRLARKAPHVVLGLVHQTTATSLGRARMASALLRRASVVPRVRSMCP